MLKILLKVGFWSYIVLLTVSLLMPVPKTGDAGQMDKVVHTAVFLLAGILLVWAYDRSINFFYGLLAYAVLIEIAQGFTGYRSFEFFDLLANTSGVIIARLISGRGRKAVQENL